MILKNKSIRTIIITLVGFLSFAFSTNAHAITEDELYTRALLNNMRVCYERVADGGEMHEEVRPGDYSKFFENAVLTRGRKKSILYVPTGIGTGNALKNENKIGCYELFLGDKSNSAGSYSGSMTGLFDMYNIRVPESSNDENAQIQFLKKIGYSEQTSTTNETKVCLRAVYYDMLVEGEGVKEIAEFCWNGSELDESNQLSSLYEYLEDGHYYKYHKNTDITHPIEVNPSIIMEGNELHLGFKIEVNSSYSPTLHDESHCAEFINPIPHQTGKTAFTKETLQEANGTDKYNVVCVASELDNFDHLHQYAVSFEYFEDDAGRVNVSQYYRLEDRSAAYDYTRSNLFGSTEEEFSDSDKYDLYNLYLKKVYGATTANDNCVSTKPSSARQVDSYQITHYKLYTSAGWCDVAVDSSTTQKKVSGFTASERYILDTEYDFAGLIDAMFDLNIDAANAVAVEEYEPGINGMTQAELSKAAQDPCYTSSDSLGWIICPIVKTATKAMLNMYDHIEEDFLVMESELTKTDSATHEAWGTFVNFANIAMVILLLIVIISQITGAGIDNYGIKKLLPKIITVAILINLSFIICQLAVDVSNIVGSSLKDLLVKTSQSTSIVNVSPCNSTEVFPGVTDPCSNSAGWFKALVTVAGGGIVGLAGASLAQGIIGNGILDGLIIPILILILVAVIAVIFFFILLGIRKAALVILIVISPLAFICYALPNTKKLFTKWFDAMKGLLLLYPICGLVIGGGTLASKIVLSASHDYVSYFIGTIIMVVPFFMVPSLLKGSFKALGGIGAKISGFGKDLRSKSKVRADKVHKNTTGYKARQADFSNRVKVRQAEADKRRADRTIARLEKRKADGHELSERQQARLYDATNTANQYENTRADHQVGVPRITTDIAKSRAESRLQAQETKLWSEQLAKADTGTITAAFEDSLAKGDVAKMSAAFEALKNTGNLPKIHDTLKRADWNNMSDGMRLALNQSMIGSGDVAMKAYAKRSFKNDNKGNFRNFMDGVDTTGQFGTIQDALKELGSHALDGQSKDTVDFIAQHTSSVGNEDWVAKMIMSGLTSTQNGEEKSKFRNMLANYANNSGADFVQNIQKAINASTLSKMDSTSFNRLNDLLGGNSEGGDYSRINEVLSGAIAELQQANNATLYASLSNDIKDKLSMQPQEVRIQVQPHVQAQPQQVQGVQTPQSHQPAQSNEPTTDFSGDGGMDG